MTLLSSFAQKTRRGLRVPRMRQKEEAEQHLEEESDSDGEVDVHPFPTSLHEIHRDNSERSSHCRQPPSPPQSPSRRCAGDNNSNHIEKTSTHKSSRRFSLTSKLSNHSKSSNGATNEHNDDSERSAGRRSRRHVVEDASRSFHSATSPLQSSPISKSSHNRRGFFKNRVQDSLQSVKKQLERVGHLPFRSSSTRDGNQGRAEEEDVAAVMHGSNRETPTATTTQADTTTHSHPVTSPTRKRDSVLGLMRGSSSHGNPSYRSPVRSRRHSITAAFLSPSSARKSRCSWKETSFHEEEEDTMHKKSFHEEEVIQKCSLRDFSHHDDDDDDDVASFTVEFEVNFGDKNAFEVSEAVDKSNHDSEGNDNGEENDDNGGGLAGALGVQFCFAPSSDVVDFMDDGSACGEDSGGQDDKEEPHWDEDEEEDDDHVLGFEDDNDDDSSDDDDDEDEIDYSTCTTVVGYQLSLTDASALPLQMSRVDLRDFENDKDSGMRDRASSHSRFSIQQDTIPEVEEIEVSIDSSDNGMIDDSENAVADGPEYPEDDEYLESIVGEGRDDNMEDDNMEDQVGVQLCIMDGSIHKLENEQDGANMAFRKKKKRKDPAAPEEDTLTADAADSMDDDDLSADDSFATTEKHRVQEQQQQINQSLHQRTSSFLVGGTQAAFGKVKQLPVQLGQQVPDKVKQLPAQLGVQVRSFAASVNKLRPGIPPAMKTTIAGTKSSYRQYAFDDDVGEDLADVLPSSSHSPATKAALEATHKNSSLHTRSFHKRSS